MEPSLSKAELPWDDIDVILIVVVAATSLVCLFGKTARSLHNHFLVLHSK